MVYKNYNLATLLVLMLSFTVYLCISMWCNIWAHAKKRDNISHPERESLFSVCCCKTTTCIGNLLDSADMLSYSVHRLNYVDVYCCCLNFGFCCVYAYFFCVSSSLSSAYSSCYCEMSNVKTCKKTEKLEIASGNVICTQNTNKYNTC